MSKIRVLVVDDSALIRKVLTTIINAQSDMEVVGVAANPLVARERIKATNPDVLTLDIEMPEMNGLDFLARLMHLRPMPVLMVSTLTERGGELTMRALELGAIDFVTKPKLGVEQGMMDYATMICEKLRVVARARVRQLPHWDSAPTPAPKASSTLSQFPQTVSVSPPAFVNSDMHPRPQQLPRAGHISPNISTEKLLIVGASTGGTEAIREFLQQLPPDCPGILIAQHMPENFTRSFAQRLNTVTALNVCEASDGQRILPGHAYVAPGHSHLLLRRSGANYVTSLSQAEPVNRHRPSVDVLFHSAALNAGANAIGVILTGMGKDGAAGMVAMHQAGALTYAQNEETCVVFGMPREAILQGGVDHVLPLSEIAPHVLRNLQQQAVRI